MRTKKLIGPIFIALSIPIVILVVFISWGTFITISGTILGYGLVISLIAYPTYLLISFCIRIIRKTFRKK